MPRTLAWPFGIFHSYLIYIVVLVITVVTPPPTAIRKNIRAPDTRIFLFFVVFYISLLFFVVFPMFFEYLDFLSPFFLSPGGGV